MTGRRAQTAGPAAAPGHRSHLHPHWPRAAHRSHLHPRWPRAAHRSHLHPQAQWGFCTIRSPLSACRRRVAPLMVQFPPFGGARSGRRGDRRRTRQRRRCHSRTGGNPASRRRRWLPGSASCPRPGSPLRAGAPCFRLLVTPVYQRRRQGFPSAYSRRLSTRSFTNARDMSRHNETKGGAGRQTYPAFHESVVSVRRSSGSSCRRSQPSRHAWASES